MKKVQRLSAFILCIIMVTLTACSKTVDIKSSTGSTQSDSQPTKFSMLGMLYNEVPDMNNSFWAEWQKKYNIVLDVQWVPYADYNSKLNLMIASAEIPDVVSPNLNNSVQREAVKNNMFWDLTSTLGDFKKYPNLKAHDKQDIYNLYCKLGGKIYGVPRMSSSINAATTIRKDLYDKLGLPLPTTTDEFASSLKQIINSPVTNPKKDLMGMVGNGVGNNSLAIVPDADGTFEAAFGCFTPTYDSEGGMIISELTPQYVDMVAYFRDLYASGCLPKEYPTFKTTQAEEAFKLGKAVAYGRGIRQAGIFLNDIKKIGGETFVLGPMKGPKGDVGVSLGTGCMAIYSINKKIPQDKMIKILNYFEATSTQDATEYVKYGIKDIHYTEKDKVKTLTEKGVKEVNTTSTVLGSLTYDRYIKVWNPIAPDEFNQRIFKQVENFDVVGQKNPFSYIVSETWPTIWAEHVGGYSSAVTKTVMGQMSMDEFKTYQKKLVSNPDIKKAFKEFAVSYKEKTGK